MPQKKNNSNNSEKPQNAYFLSLELENVRCFGERQKIDLSDGNNNPKRWTIILGDNGIGKTTLLQILASLAPVKPRKEITSSQLDTIESKGFKTHFELGSNLKSLRRNTPIINKYFDNIIDIPDDWNISAELEKTLEILNLFVKALLKEGAMFSYCTFAQGFPINTKSNNSYTEVSWTLLIGLEKEIEIVFPFGKPIEMFCFGYGASRKAGETSLSEQKEKKNYETLFDETKLLINPEEWLLQSDYASRRESEFSDKRKCELHIVKEILIKILPDVIDIRVSETESGRNPKPIVEFHTHYGWVESKDLSLGYRTSMAWIVDFASRMFDLYPESENPLAEPAVVLIDEIDLHLHPKWQRELIDYLTNLFPNTQFIVTTHSPLIVQAAAARDANIVVCRREGDHVVIDQSVEAVRGWRADQILTSDLFDLPSTRDTELEKIEKQRREILSKAKLTKADEKKLKTLSAKLDDLRVMENPEDDKAMDIIRRAAAHLQNGQS